MIGAIVVVLFVRVGHGKDYYLSPLYLMLFVIGAVAIVQLMRTSAGRISGGIALTATVAFSAVAALARLRPYCRKATLLGVTSSRYAMAFENGKIIALCEGVKPALAELWPHLKLYS